MLDKLPVEDLSFDDMQEWLLQEEAEAKKTVKSLDASLRFLRLAIKTFEEDCENE